MDKIFILTYNFCVLTLDVITDDQMVATFVEAERLSVIKAARQPKGTSKVSLVHVVNNCISRS